MPENAAQRYIRANLSGKNIYEVIWKAAPLPFKLYPNCEQIRCGYEAVEARAGARTEGDVETEGEASSPMGLASPVPSGEGLGRGRIGQMLVDIYGFTRLGYSIPMFPQNDERHALVLPPSFLRPVPAGGGLFPCELYLLVGPGTDLPAGIYHYDAAHHALDILRQGDYSSLLQSSLAHPGETPPAYTLLLSCVFWKDGFKYGAFSYRLQGLDIGTVISQSEIITHHAGLSTTIHYQFRDLAVDDLLGLDPLCESVYAVIEWRVEPSLLLPYQAALNVTEVPSAHASTQEEPHLAQPVPAARPFDSIARWPLSEAVHRASIIETRDAFRGLCALAPIKPACRDGSHTLPLSASGTPLDLWKARHKRHSARGHFMPVPMTERQLSQILLMSTHGTTNDLDGRSDFLQHTLLYCVVNRVQDVPPGIYIYQPERHGLELVRTGDTRSEFRKALREPNYNLFHMSVCLLLVGNYESGFQVYGDRWYRMQNMEAGIVIQRLYLAAAALKLGCRSALGFNIQEMDRFLGLSEEYTTLVQVPIAPERSEDQRYEQPLLLT